MSWTRLIEIIATAEMNAYLTLISLLCAFVTASNRTEVVATKPGHCVNPYAFPRCNSARDMLCGVYRPDGTRGTKMRRVSCARFCLRLVNWHLKCQVSPVVSLYLSATLGCWIRCFTMPLVDGKEGLIFIETKEGKVHLHSEVHAPSPAPVQQ